MYCSCSFLCRRLPEKTQAQTSSLQGGMLPVFCHKLEFLGTVPVELQARTSNLGGGMLPVFWQSLGFLGRLLLIF